MSKKFLEIESKYDASNIDRMQFKLLAKSLNPKSFLYVESTDIYYVKDGEFLRYRMASENDVTKRAELTYKKKSVSGNNIVRFELNLRVDPNDPETVAKFCEVLGYVRNFSIVKMCDIYYYDDADIVFYSVIDESGKVAHFVEVEILEELEVTEELGWATIRKYEELLAPLGITAQKRMRLSLFERYRVETKI